MGKVLLIETLTGKEHPDWCVFGPDYDSRLTYLCEVLPRVFAADGRHFRPENITAWRAAFLREPWVRPHPARPMRALDCLEDGQYWLLIHEPPVWGPMIPRA